MLATSCTSCNPSVQFGIEYSLVSSGETTGDVSVSFEGGHFNVDGDAKYSFSWANSFPLLKAGNMVSLSEALESNDAKTATAAKYVNDWLDRSLKVSSASGTYDIYIKGYVKETATQITFSIDRHFTNLPEGE